MNNSVQGRACGSINAAALVLRKLSESDLSVGVDYLRNRVYVEYSFVYFDSLLHSLRDVGMIQEVESGFVITEKGLEALDEYENKSQV